MKKSRLGGDLTDKRSVLLQEVMGGLDFICVNKPDCPTYSVPGRRETTIDLCFVNDSAYPVLLSWRLCEEVAMSDHKAIIVTFFGRTQYVQEKTRRPGVSPRCLEIFEDAFRTEIDNEAVDTPEQLSSLVGKIVESLSSRGSRLGEGEDWGYITKVIEEIFGEKDKDP